ncbi:phosphomethylpyrimidine synthase ThiC [Campylobacter sp. RM10532]|uniref:Phosphomethylpyrimidine synthase ThiC n=1 Tax=Campylobacter molothri TaxID=1032242 RepID=A0ACC5W0G3_9BACT|nr:phosphomethylpyrimidine synthase ThiC [Campylobacter sp. RM10542]MBZ7931578.1 phosphomethylpyrimidine synthase ThiC [Campylobacter sp. RM12910]MBZ7932885.1 phosphomethylpyrimidine synthase ThiC [Campylobacter sp. RM10543]MBZ7937193.1 phosphomethylpyrimidine synthase ThiC [Campylobacter sp. RM10538]MBZ7943527.1 phosphomethylpyrimidine synthase ThiC [Campylobacter sp. RM13744]MBZ7944658.1 phosphomethylpyrimidine synthase ThiC [Campylobacter sp. RM10532]MBZ7958296.1 phosphomethylpyrimidine sy
MKTQMLYAKEGIFTKEMQIVAQKEQVSQDFLLENIACGKIIIPANINHKSLDPNGIGFGLRTKVNVNLGVSNDCIDYSEEMKKVELAHKFEIEAIMDLSNYGKTSHFRDELIAFSRAMIGTVPVYDAVGFLEKDLKQIKAKDFLDVVYHHAKSGVDFMTIHAGINSRAVRVFKEGKRLTNIVSRGGSVLYAWMIMKEAENPFFEYYDDLLEICLKYDVTLSLGDALRPGSTHDSTDASQIAELIELSLLTQRAWEAGVQVMIEGPGHMAINEIEANMQLEKRLCKGAPFYVLGPLVTDIGAGYDHISGAIGGAVAAANGADILCYVTPAEHLRLPNLDDVRDGIVATKIAAHAGDIAKLPKERARDDDMSKARQNIDWEKMFKFAIDGEKAKKMFNERRPDDLNSCSMCGKMCAMNTMNQALKGEDVSLI